jgi:hypothetical protein
MSDGLEIYVGSANGTPRRLVQCYYRGHAVYTDALDTDNAYARQCCAKAIVDRLGMQQGEVVEWQPLAERIMQLAAEQLAKEAARAEQENGAITYRRFTSADLDAGDFTTPVIVEGALWDNLEAIIGGPSKALKTSIAADLALSIGFAGNFLGYFPVVNARKVAVFSGESGLAAIQDVARRICRAAGRRLSDASVDWSPDLPILGSEPHGRALAATLKDWGTEIAIFDPCYLMIESDGREGSMFAMGSKLRWITTVCRDCGTLPILLHHATKAPLERPMELSDLAWSGFDQWAAQWLLVNRREPYDTEAGVHRLWLSCGSRLDHTGRYAVDVMEGRRNDEGGRRWDVTVSNPLDMERKKEQARDAAKETKAAEQLERDRRAIVAAAVKLNGQPFTFTSLRSKARIRGQRFEFGFQSLVDDDTFQECELVAGNNRKYQGFKVRDE